MAAYVNQSAAPVDWPSLGQSGVMQSEVYNPMQRFARSRYPVLLQGERGLGKNQIARMIHERSTRAGKPFLTLSTLELSETFIESELFGISESVRVQSQRPPRGQLRDAEGGTVFIQEIPEFPAGIQKKLLRLLRDGAVEPLGGASALKCDVRIIASSSQDLLQLVEDGRFNADLYEELSTYSIRLPALRDRKSDVLHLAEQYLEKYARTQEKHIRRISSAAMSLLLAYAWPGNLLELEKCIARAVMLCTHDSIEPHHLPETLRSSLPVELDHTDTLQSTLSNVERALIVDALRATRGNCSKAAVMLGMTERLMGLRVKKYDIDPKAYRNGVA